MGDVLVASFIYKSFLKIWQLIQYLVEEYCHKIMSN
jgi:hypothetical protein